jgi:P27 family predicted phage terminase small subunit
MAAEAKKAWRALLPMLETMGVVTKIDANALARYCVTWARWRKAEEFIEKHGDTYPTKHRGELIFKTFPQVRNADRLATQLSRLEQSFGLTPAARTRIQVEVGPNGGRDPLGEFVARKFG